MKLVRKLVIALVVGIFGVLAVNAVMELRHDVALFEDDMAQDEHAMGHALRVAVEAVARTEGLEAAREVLREAASAEHRVTLDWVWTDDPADTPLLSADARARLQRGGDVSVRGETPAGDQQLTYVPLGLPGPRPAALLLSEPLAPPRAFMRRNAVTALGTLALLVTACGGVTMLLGVALVGRPMQALADQARRIGSGDLSRRLALPQRDEIGSLAAELNAMCDRLVAAQERVRAETEARVVALEQLRHADRLKTVGQLASGVAHELGTPLNVVAGRAKLIASGGVAAGDVAGSARVIAEQADRMTGIVRELLDFARWRGTRGVVVDLRDVIARTADMLSVMARSRRVTITTDLPSWSMPIRTEPNQLQQALTNVLVNGIQAMPAGGPLALRADRWHGTAPLGRPVADTPRWSVAVDDEGTGIPEADMEHVFEPFFTTKGAGDGTGLGLAVARGIVAEHGGWIVMDSKLGRGTRVEIVLEAEDGAQMHAEAV